MKILLLESDLLLCYIYAQALTNAGHDVTYCQDAQSAIRSLDQTLPDLIVAELQLAGHNGIEFLYELRSYTDWEQIPVMILSHIPGQESMISETLWNQLGIISYHYKPSTSLVQLIHAVNQSSVSV